MRWQESIKLDRSKSSEVVGSRRKSSEVVRSRPKRTKNFHRFFGVKEGRKKPSAIASGNLAKPGRKKNGARLARRASRNFFLLFSCFLPFFLKKCVGRSLLSWVGGSRRKSAEVVRSRRKSSEVVGSGRKIFIDFLALKKEGKNPSLSHPGIY